MATTSKIARELQLGCQALGSSPPGLRVLLIAPSHNYVGGQAVQARALCRYWAGDHNIDVSFLPVDPEPPALLCWTLKIRYLRTLVRTLLYLVTLLKAVRRVDVVHVFSASYWSFLLAPAPAVLIARLFRKNVILNYHSGEAGDHFRRWRRFVAFVLRHTDRVVVGSPYLRESFGQFGITVEVIPNVVDTQQFRFRERAPLAPRLLCTRGFEAHYRIHDVLAAFCGVKAAFPEAKLTLVGTGPLAAQLRKLPYQMGLYDVIFAGAVGHDQIADWYDSHDIFINASAIDNLPVSILEAFAAGLPIVSTDAGGIPYVVDHGRTGLLSSVGEPARLAENVMQLLRDPVLASDLASRARKECAKYSWDVVGAQWAKLYRELVGSTFGPRRLSDGHHKRERELTTT